MRELSEYLQDPIEEIHIQFGKPCVFSQPHVYGNVQLTQAAAEFMKPLFESQGWKVSISDKIPEGFINLDEFRKLKLNFAAGDLRLWYYQLTNIILPKDLQRPVLDIEADYTFSDKIIVCRTSRYNNPFIDWKALRSIKDKLMFIGLKEEHEDFCQNCFEVDFYKVENALDAARKIAGCDLMISNQCGLYAIAEQLKIPRLLIEAEYMRIENNGRSYLVPGPVNTQPQGGWCTQVGSQQKLEEIVKRVR